MALMILASKIVIWRSYQNPTTPLSPRLLSPGVPFVCSFLLLVPLLLDLILWVFALASPDPSLLPWISWPLPPSAVPQCVFWGLSETAVGVRYLVQRSPHFFTSRLWQRLTSLPILQRQECSSKKSAPHLSQFVGRRRGSRPSLQQTLSQNSCAESSVSSKKLGMMVIQAPYLHARYICLVAFRFTPCLSWSR